MLSAGRVVMLLGSLITLVPAGEMLAVKVRVRGGLLEPIEELEQEKEERMTGFEPTTFCMASPTEPSP